MELDAFPSTTSQSDHFQYECAWKPFSISWNPHSTTHVGPLRGSGSGDASDADLPSSSASLSASPSTSVSASASMSTLETPHVQMAIGSYIVDKENFIEIVNIESSRFHSSPSNLAVPQRAALASHPYLPCRTKWSPLSSQSSILATCGYDLSLWKMKQTTTVVTASDATEELVRFLQLSNKKNGDVTSAPITSLDWNVADPTLLGTSSIDTTCTIWNVQTGQAKTQLIAHDKQVYDFTFSTTPEIFASVGGDGSVRLFDLRNLEHSTILYETADATPLLRVAWNALDPHFLLTFGSASHRLTLLDTRLPSIPVAELAGPTGLLNDLTWAPHSAAHCAATSDDGRVYVWNLLADNSTHTAPAVPHAGGSSTTLHSNSCTVFPHFSFSIGEPVQQMSWPVSQPDWMAVSAGKSVQWIRI